MAKTPKKNVPKPLRTKILLPDPKPNKGILGYPLPAKLQEENRQKWEADLKRAIREQYEKLLLLAEFRGVDTKVPEWQTKLCLILASDLYTGFQIVSRKTGGPKTWDLPRYLRLICDTEKMKRSLRATRSGNITNTMALTALAKKKGGAWLPPRGQTVTAWVKTLENRIAEAADINKNPATAIYLNEKLEAARELLFDELIPLFSTPV